jgi:DNA primase catalytic subunit
LKEEAELMNPESRKMRANAEEAAKVDEEEVFGNILEVPEIKRKTTNLANVTEVNKTIGNKQKSINIKICLCVHSLSPPKPRPPKISQAYPKLAAKD